MRAIFLIFGLAVSGGIYADPAAVAGRVDTCIPVGVDDEYACNALHNVGELEASLGARGEWGSSHYPRGSQIQYFGLYFWLGGVSGHDTLVSTSWISDAGYFSNEFFPNSGENFSFQYRSIVDPDSPEYAGAVSEQDYVAVFNDTFTGTGWRVMPDYFRNRPHIPLGVEITVSSYAWSYDYAEDFILCDLAIQNIGSKSLTKCYLGLDAHSWAGWDGYDWGVWTDDVGGLLNSVPSVDGCGARDTLDMSWLADNDGDPVNGEFTDIGGLAGKSCTSVRGIMVLGAPGSAVARSYNWWASKYLPENDFGPRRRPTAQHPFRDFQWGGIGMPKGDINKYYVLSSGEEDYDVAETPTIQPTDQTWLYPSVALAQKYYLGTEFESVSGAGPFNLGPGQTVHFALAIVMGENFHTDPLNIHRLIAGDVRGYYDHLDFSDLAKNAMWAKWIYDNPGIDTDGDGYAGKQRICVFDSQYVDSHWVPLAAETTFYEGDGIPDWRGASPPPAPTFWLYPGYNSIRVRFNGQRSETTKDIFSGIIDFEGYRIYFGRDEREGSLSLIGSYDHENFDKYVYNTHKQPEPGFEIQEIPLTLEQIRCAYGNGAEPCTDSLFDPLDYGDPAHQFSPASSPDSFFFFTRHDYNASEFGVTTEVRKIYPDEPKPSSFDSLRPEQLTDDGHMKYYEYEFTIPDLLPSVPYYVNVTAFDFGSPKGNLKALETSKTVNIKHCYPAGTPQLADGSDKRVYVYPNPYRIDAEYRADGYEARMREDRPNDRVRLVHFANLPAKCTIEIHSLDGDLVRRLEHDMSPSDPNSSHDTWDLITRNTQLTVSGIYYWTVEDERGNVQIGKLVVIM